MYHLVRLETGLVCLNIQFCQNLQEDFLSKDWEDSHS